MNERMSTYETTQPWVCYHYGLTHDLWWPFWSSTRVLGHAKITCECAVCGVSQVMKVRMPRFGKVIDRGDHPMRSAFLKAHAHPDRGHPMSWAKPLLNPEAHDDGINLAALGRRIKNDLLHGPASETPK